MHFKKAPHWVYNCRAVALPSYPVGYPFDCRVKSTVYYHTVSYSIFIRVADSLFLLAQCTVLSLLFLLGGYTNVEPAVIRTVTPLNSTSAGSSSPETAVSFTLSPDSYFNDNPAPYVAGMLTLSLAGAGSFPMHPSYSWFLFSLPAIWLVANLGWAQPRERFLHIALLHTLLLIQARVYIYEPPL